MGNKSSLMLQDEEIKRIAEETGFSAQQIEKLYSRFTHLDRSSRGSLSKSDLKSIGELAVNPLCERLVEIFFADGNRKQQQQQQRSQANAKLAAVHREEDEEADEERINFGQFMRVLAAFRSSSSGPSSTNNSTSARSGRQSSLVAASAQRTNVKGAGIRAAFELVGGSQQQPTIELAATTSARGHKRNPLTEPIVDSALISDMLRDKLYFVFKIYDADADGRISFGDLRTILKLMVGSYIEEVQLDKIATRAFVEVDRDHDGFIEFREFCKAFAGKDMDLFRLSI